MLQTNKAGVQQLLQNVNAKCKNTNSSSQQILQNIMRVLSMQCAQQNVHAHVL